MYRERGERSKGNKLRGVEAIAMDIQVAIIVFLTCFC